MKLDEFNRLDAAEAAALVRPCLDVDRWITTLVAARPYADLDAGIEAARSAAAPLTVAEIESAMAHHPRIGQKPQGDSAEAAHSQREQAGLGELDDSVQARLAAANAAYEEKFDRVFLIRAAGRTPEEILSELERRMDNPADVELAETGEQLQEIAALRLEGILS